MPSVQPTGQDPPLLSRNVNNRVNSGDQVTAVRGGIASMQTRPEASAELVDLGAYLVAPNVRTWLICR
jgi:hypothetical protein